MISIQSNRPVANQYVIDNGENTYFQSYDSVIAMYPNYDSNKITLDKNYWDYSRTTSKYLYQFLRHHTGEAINYKDQVRKKIKSGEYKLANLN